MRKHTQFPEFVPLVDSIMSNNMQSFGSGVVPPPPRQPSTLLWYCNGCRRQNPGIRYRCQDCFRGDSYDLCSNCIRNAPRIHPGHRFNQVR